MELLALGEAGQESFFRYGIQGGCKFGLYEYFKKLYSDMLVGQNTSMIYFLSGASAQVFADVALCPFESIKVRVQTQSNFAKGLADGFPKVYKAEGFTGFYRGILPLWGRNLPCNNALPCIPEMIITGRSRGFGFVSFRSLQDLSGRPHLEYGLHITTERVGTYDTQLVKHFFQSLVNTSGMTLHINQLHYGVDESYNLTIPASGKPVYAYMEANSVYGALHGLQTFSQLCACNVKDLLTMCIAPYEASGS